MSGIPQDHQEAADKVIAILVESAAEGTPVVDLFLSDRIASCWDYPLVANIKEIDWYRLLDAGFMLEVQYGVDLGERIQMGEDLTLGELVGLFERGLAPCLPCAS